MRKYSLAMIGVALAVTIAACTDIPAPRTQEGGGEGLESLDVVEQVPAPKAVKGVVPDVLDVQAQEAADVVKKAGFEPVLDSLNIEFTSGGLITGDDAVCSQDPEGGAMPPKKSVVTLIYDNKCSRPEEEG